MNLNRNVLGALLVLILILVTACGNTSQPTAEKNNGSGAVQSTVTQGATVEKIKKAGKIVIGTSGNYRPYTFMDKENHLVGYDIDWGNMLADSLGVKAEFVTGAFAGLIPGLLSNRFDVVLSSLTITPERQKSLLFSEPYSENGAVAVIKKGSNAASDVEDIKGKVIGVISGSVWSDIAKQIGGYKEMKTYPGANEVFADLLLGRVQVVVVDLTTAADYIKNAPNGDQFEIAGKPYKLMNVAMGFRKDEEDLKAVADKLIQAKKADGTYNKLKQKWFGTNFSD